MLALIISWVVAFAALLGALGTFNAFRPIRRWRLLVIPSFLLGTIAAELAAFGALAFALLGGVLIQFGRPQSPIGMVGLTLLGLSGLGLLLQFVSARRASSVIEAALEGLPRPPVRAPLRWWRLLIPFPVRLARGRVTRNVEFARVAGRRLRLDVYHPRTPGPPRPAVVHVHGGGWVVGNKLEQGVPLMTVLSDRGFVGFNITYRLSPGATWPEHLVDVKRAVAWVRAHAEEYGVDPEFIAIAGGSAGGHLTAMAALVQGDPELQPGFETADTSVQAAVPLYAIYDLTNERQRHVPGFTTLLLEPLVIKAFADEEPERFVDASPLHRITADAPAFFVIHGDRDSLAPLEDAHDFVERLRSRSRAEVRFAEIPGAHHSFDLFVSPRSLPVLEGVADFLQAQYDAKTRLRPES